jgi:hypothetical protein
MDSNNLRPTVEFYTVFMTKVLAGFFRQEF